MRPEKNDLIITLGDYIDRGPRSYDVLETLIALYERGCLVPLRGNHEMMLLDICSRGFKDWATSKQKDKNQIKSVHQGSLGLWISSLVVGASVAQWKVNGGTATIKSYRQSIEAGGIITLPERHYQFLNNDCRDWFVANDFIFVHGGTPSSIPINQACSDHLHWMRTFPQTAERHCSGKIIVCGHDIQKNGMPNIGRNVICLDTGPWQGKWLTCLDLLSGQCWQANERCKVRKLDLQPLYFARQPKCATRP